MSIGCEIGVRRAVIAVDDDDHVQLPDWIEQPVPEYDLIPIHDAIGKFIRACKGMEIWLTILYSRAQRVSYDKASRSFISKHIEALSEAAELAPEDHREEYLKAMRDAASIVALRNGVVHGIGWSEGDRARTHRPDRAYKPDVEQDWLTVDYDRELLIGAGRRANEISGFIQAEASRWPGFDYDE